MKCLQAPNALKMFFFFFIFPRRVGGGRWSQYQLSQLLGTCFNKKVLLTLFQFCNTLGTKCCMIKGSKSTPRKLMRQNDTAVQMITPNV